MVVNAAMEKLYMDAKGYPRWKDSGKLAHRTMVEKKLGIKIPTGFVVHHINWNKRDFGINNLALMTETARRLHGFNK